MSSHSQSAQDQAARYQFAQLNIARLRHPLDAEGSAEFVAALDPINELAEAAEGFVWRLTDESGQSSSYVSVDEDPLFLVNLSVWETPEQLHDFVYSPEHRSYLRRRREWFEAMDRPVTVCWWVAAGHEPTAEEALDRLAQLEALKEDGSGSGSGATPTVFPFRTPFPPPPG